MFHFTNPHQNILVRAGCEADVACSNPRPETQRKTREKSMNPANLPFDSETMLQGLRGWVECESPTWDKGAVERMLDIAARDMAIMGATIERIAGRQGFAGCVRARFPHPKLGEPGILIAGHLDTVHPVGTIEKLKWRREGNKCFGPGIFDMKGGNYLSLEAIRQLARAAFTTPLPITVLFTPDEEVGTPSTRDIIEAEAARNKYVLVPEPGRPNNGVVTGRYAIARFNLEAVGKPSHAGATLSSGRSAIREMARQIIAIDGMTTEDCTFSVGIVHGGQWVNCVATTCTGEALSMAKRQADLDRGVERMLALTGSANDVTFTVTRGVSRTPAPWRCTKRRAALPNKWALSCRTAAPAAVRTAISPARWAYRRSTASVSAAPMPIRSTNISRSTAWPSAAG
jgi:glutamate carboxypeptidase